MTLPFQASGIMELRDNINSCSESLSKHSCTIEPAALHTHLFVSSPSAAIPLSLRLQPNFPPFQGTLCLATVLVEIPGSNMGLANVSSPIQQLKFPKSTLSLDQLALARPLQRPVSPPPRLGRSGQSESQCVQWGPSFLVGPSSRTGGWGLCLVQAQMPYRNSLRCLINAPLTLEVIFSIRCPKISMLCTHGKM